MIKQQRKLYKLTSTGATQVWYLEVDGNKYRSVSGQLNGKHVTAEWTVVSGKNIGRANETSPVEQCLAEVQANYTKKLAQGAYSETLKGIDAAKVAYFKVMLAKDYNEYPLTESEFKASVFVQPKLDGMRCITSSTGCWSRGGKPIQTVDFIQEIHAKIVKLTGMTNLILDGELYNHDLRHDFNKIMSLCKKQKPTDEDKTEASEKIQYWVYDLPMAAPFAERSQLLRKIVEVVNDPRLVFVPTMQVFNTDEVDNNYEKLLSEEYEGQMIRVGTDGYENKRTNKLLKRKEFQDSEFKILDIIEGSGNRSGMAGAMMFETKDGKPFNANVMGDRDFLRDMLKRKKKIIGSDATVCYFKPTPDGIPRFPRVKAVFEGKRDV